jgi:flagellar protein FliJ
MKQTLPLKMLIELAQGEVDEATRRLGTLQQQRNDAQRQLDALTQYRDEYRRKLAESVQSGMDAANWRNFQQFIDTLDVAMSQQRSTVDSAEARLHAGRLDWQTRKQKLNSFETLQNRAQQRENQRLARLEQRESDEFAAKSARLRGGLNFE